MSLNLHTLIIYSSFFFFFNDTATTEIYTLSLHDALPISPAGPRPASCRTDRPARRRRRWRDRKSTRLNSSHTVISYAVFCLKKKALVKLYRQIYLERRFEEHAAEMYAHN